ncbi:hypothetical protein ATCC90586_003198 [Pythium insidiosum]|nr:hypothetical protein ATCC90586_003198 [Pythium insidiosum]
MERAIETPTTARRSRRRVLASLVPVATREDPLDATRLPSTDVDVPTALALRKPPRLVEVSRNQHEDVVSELDRRIEQAKRRWSDHQQEVFAVQIAARGDAPTPRQQPRKTTPVPRKQRAAEPSAVVFALDTAQVFLQRAGDELSRLDQEPDKVFSTRWHATHDLYVQYKHSY